MNKQEFHEKLYALRDKHTREQDDLDFRQNKEIEDLRSNCNHDWTEPYLDLEKENFYKICMNCGAEPLLT
jgi:hypothetical protein